VSIIIVAGTVDISHRSFSNRNSRECI